MKAWLGVSLMLALGCSSARPPATGLNCHRAEIASHCLLVIESGSGRAALVPVPPEVRPALCGAARAMVGLPENPEASGRGAAAIDIILEDDDGRVLAFLYLTESMKLASWAIRSNSGAFVFGEDENGDN